MPIISLSSFKGGVAKTTSAIYLASLFSKDGATLVIDADPNRSATTWAKPGGTAVSGVRREGSCKTDAIAIVRVHYL
ncbi:plasmid partitioning protein, ParA family [Scytonema sp. HK-05]|uniref:ParA family protein n=1 Tax=Scytonema sp. HK-05 TaxID=1137095 RepID=UPI0009365F85|nr:ParA family protein [Scytonema sp. HK-05]OKH58733.1 hypothetical protein NIES2130_12715 [Scytonema sp. HK-05]BAY43405.1 plasmid partitioning protein, ParA family [Scytonema sp. HK-05]